MRSNPIHGLTPDEAGRRWFVDLYEQWSGVFSPGNWTDFTVVDLTVEHSPYKGSGEASLAVLGLRVTVTYVYDLKRDTLVKKRADEFFEQLKGREKEGST